jgi:predicted nucleic acid-binding protein
LLEYEEIISIKYSSKHLESFLGFISFSPHVRFYQPSFRFHLIESDPDDNKFVDCAICSDAEAIVTSDRHFHILKRIEFPRVIVLSPGEFIKVLLQMNLT